MSKRLTYFPPSLHGDGNEGSQFPSRPRLKPTLFAYMHYGRRPLLITGCQNLTNHSWTRRYYWVSWSPEALINFTTIGCPPCSFANRFALSPAHKWRLHSPSIPSPAVGWFNAITRCGFLIWSEKIGAPLLGSRIHKPRTVIIRPLNSCHLWWISTVDKMLKPCISLL